MSESQSPLAHELARIRAYTRSHESLSSCHHFQFDLPLNVQGDASNDPVEKSTYVVLGINPGEIASDHRFEGPTEESSEFDFHSTLDGRDDIRWTRALRRILPVGRVLQSQLFFWSSNDADELQARLGQKLERAKAHLEFCRDMNLKMIDVRSPDAVILAGMSKSDLAQNLYELKEMRVVPDKFRLREKGGRLVRVFSDCQERPWIAVPHLTSCRPPLTENEAEMIRQIVEQSLRK